MSLCYPNQVFFLRTTLDTNYLIFSNHSICSKSIKVKKQSVPITSQKARSKIKTLFLFRNCSLLPFMFLPCFPTTLPIFHLLFSRYKLNDNAHDVPVKKTLKKPKLVQTSFLTGFGF